jgi:phosphate transport system protein
MDKLAIGQHISQQFNAELEDVRQRVLAMGGLVEQQIADAVVALTEGRTDLAQSVEEGDVRVNSFEVHIDEECSRILARRQPTASDLRLVVAVIKTITDLERIGDEAERIARMAINLAGQGETSKSFYEIEHLGAHVRAMVGDSLDAFARMDSRAALAVAQEDAKVDREYEAIMRQSITFMMEDPRSIRHVLDIMWAVRSLERIGDHARNIAEYVIYFVEGKDVRHISLEAMEAELDGC